RFSERGFRQNYHENHGCFKMVFSIFAFHQKRPWSSLLYQPGNTAHRPLKMLWGNRPLPIRCRTPLPTTTSHKPFCLPVLAVSEKPPVPEFWPRKSTNKRQVKLLRTKIFRLIFLNSMRLPTTVWIIFESSPIRCAFHRRSESIKSILSMRCTCFHRQRSMPF